MKQSQKILKIHKNLTERQSEQEQNAHNAWLAEHDSNKVLQEEIQSVWDASLDYSPAVDFDSQKAFGLFKAKMDQENVVVSTTNTQDTEPTENAAKVISLWSKKWVYGLTACFAIAMLSMFFFDQSSDSTMSYAALDDDMRVELDDHSIVVIKKGSTLSVDNNFNKNTRTTHLEGMAYFDIERNENVPFIINSKHGNVKVLGTSFNLDVKSSQVVLEVEEGLVAFSSSQSTANELFKVGEKMVYDVAHDKVVRASVKDAATFKWMNDGLKFIDMSLPAVFTQLGDYFNVSFEYSSTDLQDMANLCPHVTLTKIKAPELSNILNTLKELSGVEYRFVNENKTVRVIALDCN